jgi:ATP-dependent RNA helicase DHX29
MLSIATPSLQQSEGYLCTVMMFILSPSTKDDKIYLRLQSVWRDVWKELLEQKQEELDRADRGTLKRIQALIVEKRALPNHEAKERSEVKTSKQGADERPKPREDKKIELSPESMKDLWERRSSTVRYQKMLQTRQQLPIWQHRQHIVGTLSANQVTILCAETGAGKSTQVPSFVLESHLSAGHDCKILITQPRRISAISLARRVSEELGEQKSDIGTRQSLVGFAIRLESKVSSTTRITFVTTGVLLRMIESSKDLDGLDFLILDEVHERTMDLDLLFIALRRLLKRRHDLKLVLMSATVDARKFSEYFGDAPILNIPGRMFPVEVNYLEDAVELTQDMVKAMSGPHEVETYDNDTIERSESERSLTVGLDSYSTQTRKALAALDEYRIDYTLIANLAIAISGNEKLRSTSILIFMPGIAEIRRLHRTILSLPAFTSGWVIHLLHSSFSNDDLEKAFERPPAQYKKIVIATNIAESGITIPDITAVIDSCREKVMRFDERRQLSKLTESFISRSSARQRRGRAARVQEGVCFHLVTRYRYENLLPEHHVPEMLRLGLVEPILRIKVWDIGADVEETLKEAFDPPSKKNVTRGLQLLKDVKALTDTELLTPLGKQLARLPVDIWLGKLVLRGLSFACLDAVVFITAMLSYSKSPFTDTDRSNTRAAAARLAFDKCNSDLLLVYNAYCAWKRAYLAGNVHEFCRKSFLDHYTLSQIEDQKVQLLVTLSDADILDLDEGEKKSLKETRLGGRTREFFTIPHRFTWNSNNEFAVSSVIAMALYPKLLVRERQGWRNVANNQQVNICPTSVNYGASRAQATWLSFYQTMQTKSKNPTVFETSLVSEAAIVLLLGEADFRMYAGVIILDGGKVLFRVRDWKTMIALTVLRLKIQEALSRSYRNTDSLSSDFEEKWLSIWQQIVASKKAQENKIQ